MHPCPALASFALGWLLCLVAPGGVARADEGEPRAGGEPPHPRTSDDDGAPETAPPARATEPEPGSPEAPALPDDLVRECWLGATGACAETDAPSDCARALTLPDACALTVDLDADGSDDVVVPVRTATCSPPDPADEEFEVFTDGCARGLAVFYGGGGLTILGAGRDPVLRTIPEDGERVTMQHLGNDIDYIVQLELAGGSTGSMRCLQHAPDGRAVLYASTTDTAFLLFATRSGEQREVYLTGCGF